MPALDVSETDDMVEITAEFPGAKEEDTDVSVTEGVLTLQIKKPADAIQKTRKIAISKS